MHEIKHKLEEAGDFYVLHIEDGLDIGLKPINLVKWRGSPAEALATEIEDLADLVAGMKKVRRFTEATWLQTKVDILRQIKL